MFKLGTKEALAKQFTNVFKELKRAAHRAGHRDPNLY